MADELHIKVTLDDTNVDKRLQKLSQGIDNIGDEAKGTNLQLIRINSNLVKMGNALQRSTIAANRKTASVIRLRRSYGLFGDSMTRTIVNLGMLEAAFHSVGTLLFSWQNYILTATSDLDKMRIMMQQLSTATDPVADSIEQVNYVLEFSKNAPYTIDAITDAYKKLKVSGIDPANGSLLALVDANSAFGGTSENLKRASIAIQQMVGKGVVSMEELRQQIGESIPSAMKLMARGMGVTMAELVKLVESGKLKAKPALDAMLDQFKLSFGGAAESLMETYEGQLAKFQTNMKILAKKAGDDGGYYGSVVEGLKELNTFLESDAGAAYARQFGEALSYLVEKIKEFVKFLYVNRNEILYWGEILAKLYISKVVLSTFGALITKVGALGVGFAKLFSGFKTFATAIGGFTLSSTFVKGSVGAFFGGRAIRSIANTTKQLRRYFRALSPIAGKFQTIRMLIPLIIAGIKRAVVALGPMGWIISGIAAGWALIAANADKAALAARYYKMEKIGLADKINKDPGIATETDLKQLTEDLKTIKEQQKATEKQFSNRRIIPILKELQEKNLDVTQATIKSTDAFREYVAQMSKTELHTLSMTGAFDKLIERIKDLGTINLNLETKIENNLLAQDNALETTLYNQYKANHQLLAESQKDEMAEISRLYREQSDRLSNEYQEYVDFTDERNVDILQKKKTVYLNKQRALEIKTVRKMVDIYQLAQDLIKGELNALQNNWRDLPYQNALLRAGEEALKRATELTASARRQLNDRENAPIGYQGIFSLGGSRADELNVMQGKLTTMIDGVDRRIESLKGRLFDTGKEAGNFAERIRQLFPDDAPHNDKFLADLDRLMAKARQLDQLMLDMKDRQRHFNAMSSNQAFVESMGLMGSAVDKFKTKYQKAFDDYRFTIDNFNTLPKYQYITAEANDLAHKQLEIMSQLYAVQLEMNVDRTLKSFVSTHLPQYKQSLALLHEQLSVKQQMAEYDKNEIRESSNIDLSIAQMRQQGKDKALIEAAEKQRDERAKNSAARRSAYLAQALQKEAETQLPLLQELQDAAAEQMDYGNQKTKKLALEVFDHKVNMETKLIEKKMELAEDDVELYRHWEQKKTLLAKLAEERRIEISQSTLHAHFEQYRNHTEAMNSIIIDAFEGIGDSLIDSVMNQEDSWKSLGETILKQIGRLILFKGVLEPIADMVDQMFNGGGKGGGKGGSGASFWGFLGNVVSSGISTAFSGFMSPKVSTEALNKLKNDGAYSRYGIEKIGNVSNGQQAVTVNITNKSGKQVQGKSMQRVSDGGRQQIIDVVLDEMSRPSDMRDGFRTA